MGKTHLSMIPILCVFIYELQECPFVCVNEFLMKLEKFKTRSLYSRQSQTEKETEQNLRTLRRQLTIHTHHKYETQKVLNLPCRIKSAYIIFEKKSHVYITTFKLSFSPFISCEIIIGNIQDNSN